MTPQETQLLQAFLDRLTQTQAVNKDPDAEQRIAQAIAKQPDAAFLLTQRALLLEQAVANAQSQIAQLQSEIQELKAANASDTKNASTNSFFDANNAWGRSAPTPRAASTINTTSQFGAQPNPQANYAAPASSGFFGGNTGSLLGTVAATAAGVAAGAFLYQGLGSLMGNNTPANTPEASNNLTDTSNNLDHNQGNTPDAGSASLSDNGSDGLIPNYFEEDSGSGDFDSNDDTI